VTYIPTSPQTYNAPPPTSFTYGAFDTVVPAGTTLTAGGNFTLAITQTIPSAGTGSITDVFSGSVTNTAGATSGSLGITFGGPNIGYNPSTSTLGCVVGVGGCIEYTYITIDGVEYGVQTNNALATNGFYTLPGFVDPIVPEPTFYWLTGTGFAGLLFMAIRRRRQRHNLAI
jgi:hypothetical protein